MVHQTLNVLFFKNQKWKKIRKKHYALPRKNNNIFKLTMLFPNLRKRCLIVVRHLIISFIDI